MSRHAVRVAMLSGASVLVCLGVAVAITGSSGSENQAATVGGRAEPLPPTPGEATTSGTPAGCTPDVDPYYDTPEFEQKHPELLGHVLDDRDGRELCLTEKQISTLAAEQAQMEAERRAAGLYPPPGQVPVSQSADEPPADPEGLNDSPEAFVPAAQLVPVNGWEDQRGDVRLVIEAGSRSTYDAS